MASMYDLTYVIINSFFIIMQVNNVHSQRRNADYDKNSLALLSLLVSHAKAFLSLKPKTHAKYVL